jgi:hypothetical protein
MSLKSIPLIFFVSSSDHGKLSLMNTIEQIHKGCMVIYGHGMGLVSAFALGVDIMTAFSQVFILTLLICVVKQFHKSDYCILF